MCGKCKEGYVRVGQECRDCDGHAWAQGLYFVGISCAWVAFICWIAGNHAAITPPKKILIYYIQTLLVTLGPTSTWFVVRALLP
jgi:hypothetical protein